jgi:hypothetical protein
VLGEEFEPPLPSLGRALRYWDELYLFASTGIVDSG